MGNAGVGLGHAPDCPLALQKIGKNGSHYELIRTTTVLWRTITVHLRIMITVISGTDRKDSMTLRVATLYRNLLAEKAIEAKLVSLEGLEVWRRGEALLKVEEEILIPTEKFVLVMPEYNGSFPGILKLLMDNSDIKRVWWHKKAMLVGLADGRAGNLRGLDHMTNILNYLKVQVLYNKIPLSRINTELDEAGQLRHESTKNTISQQVDEFIKF